MKIQTVDSEELSTILESAGLFFTSSQIQDILSKVDADDDIALDFVEVLQVRPIYSNLPQNLGQGNSSGKSGFCSFTLCMLNFLGIEITTENSCFTVIY